jgi:hypothetical protein
MKTNFVQTLPARHAKAKPGPNAAVWIYALVLFVGESLFTVLGTGSY